MTLHKTTQLPISVGRDRKRDVRAQFAALCYRIVKDRPQILLISSRDTGRWIIPKGWPVDGATPAETAAIEAWEEAGAEGRAMDFALGMYSYNKLLDDGTQVPCLVTVFPFRVKRLAAEYPECEERKRKWFTPKKAAALVHEPGLAQILMRFDPRRIQS